MLTTQNECERDETGDMYATNMVEYFKFWEMLLLLNLLPVETTFSPQGARLSEARKYSYFFLQVNQLLRYSICYV